MDITLKELQSAKKKAEKDIAEIIKSFTVETSVSIKCCGIDFVYGDRVGGARVYLLSTVQLTLFIE